jgi:hypothetical protein
MSQALGEIASHIPNPMAHRAGARGKYNTMLMSLANAVTPNRGPEGQLELAAMLESQGVTDAVAARYGTGDVFELASALLASSQSAERPAPQAAARTGRLVPRLLLLSLSRSLLMIAMMGMLLVGVQWYERAMRALGVPGWTTMLGLFAAMAIAGGMMQASGWRVSQALSQGTPRAVGPLLLLGLAFGMSIAVFVSLMLVGAGTLLALPLAGLAGLGASCLGLTFLLLLSGSLVLLDRTYLAGAAIALAGAAGWLAHIAGLIPPDTFALIIVSYVVTIVLLAGLLAQTIRHMTGDQRGYGRYQMPPLGQLLYNATPYLIYGALAVIYVFLGQLNGWVGSVPAGWTRDQAIAALNVAHLLSLVTVVVSQGVAEYALRIFWNVMRSAQSQVGICDYATIRATVQLFLRRHLRIVLLSQMLAALAMAALAQWLWAHYPMQALLGPLNMPMLAICLAGYSFLAWGLFGCSFAVTVTQPWLTVRTLLAALVIGFVAGLLLSQLAGFELSVVGTVVGGACLVLSARQMLARLLDRIDYLLYQAF